MENYSTIHTWHQNTTQEFQLNLIYFSNRNPNLTSTRQSPIFLNFSLCMDRHLTNSLCSSVIGPPPRCLGWQCIRGINLPEKAAIQLPLDSSSRCLNASSQTVSLMSSKRAEFHVCLSIGEYLYIRNKFHIFHSKNHIVRIRVEENVLVVASVIIAPY